MTTIILFSMIIIAFASIVQGMTSFGFSLLAVPLLSLFLPLQVIVPLIVVYSLFLNGMILLQLKGKADKKFLGTVLLAGAVTTPLGAQLLKNMNPDLLKLSVGVTIALAAILMMFGIKAKVKNRRLSLLLAGAFSGLLNGSISMSGPPIILFLRNDDQDKDQFRKNLTSLFFLLNILTTGVFILTGQLNASVMTTGLQLFPALLLGTWLGVRLGNNSNEALFKKLTLALILIMGILSIVSANPMQFLAN